MEHSEITIGEGTLAARGVQVAADPLPYRLEYELDTGPDYVTRSLALRARGSGWTRSLDLARGADGTWTAEGGGAGGELPAAGGDTAPYAESLDCDIAFCPVTNAMPVLRHGMLEGGEPRDFVMAWVSVPDLAVSRSEQRYEPVSQRADGAVVRFVGEHRSFVGELEFDRDGLVVFYPELAELLGR
jgi:hypothetical protein